MRVDAARLERRLEALARIGRDALGGVSRLAYGDADREARQMVMDMMRGASLDPRIDAAANIVGRRAGSDASLPPLLFGSHVDSVPNGGDYDGPLGTLAAIEAVQVLVEQQIVTRHPLEVVVWSNEEGGLYGSRAASGRLPARELGNVAASGRTVSDGIRFLGGDPSQLASAVRAPGSIAGYLELHIEQGAVLEAAGADIGIVEGIAGIWQWDVTITGAANHAGTTPMDRRHDALLAAARFIDMVNHVVVAEPGRQTGTVGRIDAMPGAPNAIAGRVTCSLELRDLDAPKVARLFARIQGEGEGIAAETGTTLSYAGLISTTPAPCDARIQSAIADAAAALGLRTLVMPSGAGHDAQEMARIGPAGMIFVPSVGGVSHSPAERTRDADVTNGANVLLDALVAVDRLLSGDCEPLRTP